MYLGDVLTGKMVPLAHGESGLHIGAGNDIHRKPSRECNTKGNHGFLIVHIHRKLKLAVAYLVTGQANVLIITSFSIIAINRSDDPHFVPTCRLCVANIALIERVTQIPRDVSDEKSMYIRYNTAHMNDKGASKHMSNLRLSFPSSAALKSLEGDTSCSRTSSTCLLGNSSDFIASELAICILLFVHSAMV